jgi:hypothetical protein
MSFVVKKESDWQFVTSSTGGLGVEFVGLEGGMIWLQDPARQSEAFGYGAAGIGITEGLKVPKIGKVQLKVRGKGVGGVIAPASFPNTGKVYVLETFAGDELTASDIRGVCVFCEVYGGAIAGGSATAMIFGMSPVWLGLAIAAGPLGPIAMMKLIETATGVLLMAGVNAGIQAGVGAGVFLGALF